MNVPAFVSARRSEIDRFLPMLFSTSTHSDDVDGDGGACDGNAHFTSKTAADFDIATLLRRRGRAIHRRPASANTPLSRATREFISSLPSGAVRRRAPLVKFGRSRAHWARKVKLASPLMSTKKKLQMDVIMKRSKSLHRRARRTVRRRALRRRIRLAVGVRLGRSQRQGISSAGNGAAAGRVLVLPSHRWLARRFVMRTQVRVCGPWPAQHCTAYLDASHQHEPFTLCSVAVCEKRTMKQFRRVLATTTTKHTTSSADEMAEPADRHQAHGVTKATAPPAPGVLVDCSGMYVFHITANLGSLSDNEASHLDTAPPFIASEDVEVISFIAEHLPSALTRIAGGGDHLVFPHGSGGTNAAPSLSSPGSVVRAILRVGEDRQHVLPVFLCRAVTFGNSTSAFFLLVPSAEHNASEAPDVSLLTAFLQKLSLASRLVLREGGPASTTGGREVVVKISQSTLWSPARHATPLQHPCRTGVLSLIIPLGSRRLTESLVASHIARAVRSCSAGDRVTISHAYLEEASAVTHQRRNRCGFGRVLLFVHADTQPSAHSLQQRVAAIAPQPQRQQQQQKGNRMPRAPRVDAEESTRENAFRVTRELFRALVTSSRTADHADAAVRRRTAGAFLPIGCREELYLYEQHCVPHGFHGPADLGGEWKTALKAANASPQLTYSGTLLAVNTLLSARSPRSVALRAACAANGTHNNKLRIQPGDLVIHVEVLPPLNSDNADQRGDARQMKRKPSKRGRDGAVASGNGRVESSGLLRLSNVVCVGVVTRHPISSDLLGSTRVATAFIWGDVPAQPPQEAMREPAPPHEHGGGSQPLTLVMVCSAAHAVDVGIIPAPLNVRAGIRAVVHAPVQPQRQQLTFEDMCSNHRQWTHVEFA